MHQLTGYLAMMTSYAAMKSTPYYLQAPLPLLPSILESRAHHIVPMTALKYTVLVKTYPKHAEIAQFIKKPKCMHII